MGVAKPASIACHVTRHTHNVTRGFAIVAGFFLGKLCKMVHSEVKAANKVAKSAVLNEARGT